MQPKDNPATEQFNYMGIAVTIIALVILALFIDLDSLKVWIERAGIWAPLVFILLKISTIIIAPLSGGPLYPIVGLLFGFWPGILFVIIGDTLGYSLAFFISRVFGRDKVFALLSKNEEGLLARTVRHVGTPKGFFQACMTLFAVPEVLSYGAGLSKLPYLSFILILAPLSAVAASVLVYFGSILNPTNDSLLVSLGIPVLGLIAVVLGGYLFTKGIVKKS